MFDRYLYYLKRTDWIIFCTVVLIISLGLLAIYSTSFYSAEQNSDVFYKQVIFAVIGLAIMLILSFIDFRFYRAYANILYLGGIILLSAVLIIGTEIRGTTGWIFVGNYGFQPVEIVKIFLLLVLAKYYSHIGNELHRVRHILISAVLTVIYIGFVFMQPDVGSALVYFVVWFGSLFLLNIKRSYILTILLIIIIVVSLGWAFALKDYQKERITNFLNPSHDPLETGYNITQSIVAVGSGQIWGRGLGLGSQSQLKFLPEHQTDFIFAVIAEELGFIGASLLIVLFGVLFFRLIRVARQAKDDFSVFLTSGIIIVIFFQLMINIGMNLGLAPVIGIPLPFVSAGGSSLLSSLVMIGLTQSLIIHRK